MKKHNQKGHKDSKDLLKKDSIEEQAEKAHEAVEEAAETVEETAEGSAEAAEEATEAAEEVAAAEEAVETAKESAEEAVESSKEAVEELAKEVAGTAEDSGVLPAALASALAEPRAEIKIEEAPAEEPELSEAASETEEEKSEESSVIEEEKPEKSEEKETEEEKSSEEKEDSDEKKASETEEKSEEEKQEESDEKADSDKEKDSDEEKDSEEEESDEEEASDDEKKNEEESAKERSALYMFLDTVKFVAIGLLIGILLVIFVIQRNDVYGSSMEPTLHTGDAVFVEMISVYTSNFHRGDIITIDAKGMDGYTHEEDLIKRIVGLPGETIKIEDGNVYINGQLLDESAYLPAGTKTYVGAEGQARGYQEITLGPDEYYCMGDNRGGSNDSRRMGPFKKSQIDAKVLARIYPFNKMKFF